MPIKQTPSSNIFTLEKYSIEYSFSIYILANFGYNNTSLVSTMNLSSQQQQQQQGYFPYSQQQEGMLLKNEVED